MTPKKILLIDDEELVVKSVANLLKKQGYEVHVCKNGEDALEKIKSCKFNLIISDIRMPGMNGVEVIRRIREYYKSQNIRPTKEIIITGYAEEKVNREADELQVADYIYKPFDLRDFLNAVQKNMTD